MLAPLRTFLLVLWSVAALASRPAQAIDRSGEALRHHDKGRQLYLSGFYEEAARELEQAYALDPDPILLFDIAQAHRRNGTNEKAILA